MMELRTLVWFRTVAAHGSLSAAALELSVSQPAVSRQIANLERNIGARLFRRTAVGMKLTPAGERFLSLATDLVIRAGRAQEIMRTMHEEVPSFYVACPETTAIFSIAPFIAETAAPIVDIRPTRPADVYATLAEGVDLAVGTSTPPVRYHTRSIVDVPISVQFVQNHGWIAAGVGVELVELSTRRIVMPGYGSAVERTVREAAASRGLTLDLAHVTSNSTIAQALTAAGHGSCLVTEPVQFGLHQAPLLFDGQPLTITLYAAWEADHYASDKISTVVDQLVAWMRTRYLTDLG
ncbi:LysR family transcriptional regulator (plasmid) [Rhodococcoides fascians]|uniref:LysR family transcriptional regulator n=1 Tax=Rhodococcoides fascians TaxID=1828 RepID=UPI00389AD023